MPSQVEDDIMEDPPNLENDDPDTLRIMLSTDNHLGYGERDNVRSNDSFCAFEEMLYLAKRFQCDLVVLAGDLFHENRPSRGTLHTTMEILRRYTMGPGAVRVEMLSTPNFRSAETANYLDPNYSVQLPIFSIHGNHDDPNRDRGGGKLLAALDLLAMSNLVNYFGHSATIDSIEVSPVILRKGTTRLALYGLGSHRDERLHRMWRQNKVRFLKDQDSEDTFNLFLLHQNRDLGRGAKNCIQEQMIPDWMDAVVWGHEHECKIEFAESVVGTFRITQPGSSVATSLVSGEAARKHVGVLDVKGKQFRMSPIPLTQVRSFVTTELAIRDHRDGLDPDDPQVEKKMTDVLTEEVRVQVLNARDKAEEVEKAALKAGNNAAEADSDLKHRLNKPEEVLVRLRVEHSGFSTLNNQRFGANFIGKVANVSDILLFHRKREVKQSSVIKKHKIEPIAPDDLEKIKMEDLVREHLLKPGDDLKLFNEKPLTEALEDYVEKSRASAIQEMVQEYLDSAQVELIEDKGKGDDDDEQDGDAAPVKLKNTTKKVPVASVDVDDSMEDSPAPKPRKKAATKRAPAKRKQVVEEIEDSDDDFGFQTQKSKVRSTAKKATTARTTARKTTKRKAPTNYFDDSDDDDFGGGLRGAQDDFDDDWENAPTQSQRSRR